MKIIATRVLLAGWCGLSGCLYFIAPALRAQSRQPGDYDSVGAHPDHPADAQTQHQVIFPDQCQTPEKCASECEQKRKYFSCYRAGAFHAAGDKVEKNLAQAAHYFRRACELGDGHLCALLGWELRYGATLKRDDKQADEADRLACEKGIPQSCAAPPAAAAEPVKAPPPSAESTPATATIPVPKPLPLPPPNCTGKPAEGDGARKTRYDRSYLPDAGKIVEVSALPDLPTLLDRASPDYPDPVVDRTLAGQFYFQGMSGETMIDVIIDEQGNVTHPLLICADNLRKTVYELAALKKWRYQPVSLDGKPVKVRHVITFKLAIGKSKK